MGEEWLMAVDMQRAFADAGGRWAVPGFELALRHVEALVVRHRPRVILTRYVAPPTPEGILRTYYDERPDMLLPESHAAWDLMLADANGLPVMTRATFAKWDDDIAGMIGRDATLVLCGVATECCVLATALRAIDHGVRVRVIAAACAGATPALHRQALDVMASLSPLITVEAG